MYEFCDHSSNLRLDHKLTTFISNHLILHSFMKSTMFSIDLQVVESMVSKHHA